MCEGKVLMDIKISYLKKKTEKKTNGTVSTKREKNTENATPLGPLPYEV